MEKQANNFIKTFFSRAAIVLVANQIVTTFVLKFDVAAAIYPAHEALVDGVWGGKFAFSQFRHQFLVSVSNSHVRDGVLGIFARQTRRCQTI